MNTITYYAMRRLLGAVAKLLDRIDRRERERQAQLRANWDDAREGQHHAQRSQDAAGPTSTTVGTHSLTDMKPGMCRAEQENTP